MKTSLNFLFFITALLLGSTSPIWACATNFESRSMYALATFAKAAKDASGSPTEDSLRIASVNHFKEAVKARHAIWEDVTRDLSTENGENNGENIVIRLLEALHAKIENDFAEVGASGKVDAVEALAYIQLASLYLSISPDLHLSAIKTFSLESLAKTYPTKSVLSPFFDFGPKPKFLDETSKDLQTFFALVLSVQRITGTDRDISIPASLDALLDVLVQKVYIYSREAVLAARETGLRLAFTKELPSATQMNHALSQGYYLVTAR